MIKRREKIVNKLREFIGDKNAIIGESGGVDSALVTFLCEEAIGADRVIARTMPYGSQSTVDADLVASTLKLKDYGCVNIKPIVDSFGFSNLLTVGNTKARVRMSILYALALENNGLVIGTGNKTEMMIGYFTKYGDGGVDVEPIADLYKTEVFAMSRTYPSFPLQIVEKAPSAELWDGQTDENEIGMTYPEMDMVLRGLETFWGCNKTLEAVKHLFDAKTSIILERVVKSEHKRHIPPTFHV